MKMALFALALCVGCGDMHDRPAQSFKDAPDKGRPDGIGYVAFTDEASPCCAYYRDICVKWCEECQPSKGVSFFHVRDVTDEEWATIKYGDCYRDGVFSRCASRHADSQPVESHK